MGLFDNFNPNMGWLGNAIRSRIEDTPADIMNPQIYGNVAGANTVGNVLSSILPPLNGGAQPSPYMASPQAIQQQQATQPPPLSPPITIGPQRFGPGPSAPLQPAQPAPAPTTSPTQAMAQ